MSISDDFAAYPRERGLAPAFSTALVAAALLAPLTYGDVAQALVLFGLALLMFYDTRAAGYGANIALTLTALACGGIALMGGLGRDDGAIVLSLAVYVVASRAVALCARPTSRHVIAMSVALALAQILDPLGAGFGALLLPVLVSIAPRQSGNRRAGYAMLLMFVPVMSMLGLAYLRGILGINLWAILAPASLAVPSNMPLAAILAGACIAAPPLWLTACVRSMRSRPGTLTLGIAAAFLIALAGAGIRGVERDPSAILAAMLALSMAGLCAWPRAQRHGELAVASMALGIVMGLLALGLFHNFVA